MTERISKRGALRFDAFARPIRYRTEYDDGHCTLVNISTGGCAVEQASTDFSEREKVLLIIPLDGADDEIEIQAVVVRAGQNSAGLQFRRVSEVNKHRILHFFAQEKRRRQQASAT